MPYYMNKIIKATIEAAQLNLPNDRGQFILAAKYILIEQPSMRSSYWPHDWPLSNWEEWCDLNLIDRLTLAQWFIKMALIRFDENKQQHHF